jgi:hypothetical protein
VILLLTDGGKALLFGPAMLSVGLVLFVRGLLRCRDSFAPLPWGKVIAAGAIPVLGSIAILGFVSLRESRLREAEARAEAEREMLEKREEAERIRQQTETEEWVAARREAARVARREQNAKQVQRHLARLRTSRTSSICDAALKLARLEVYESIPDLEAALRDSTSTTAQNCVAAALADLGETHTALIFYVDCGSRAAGGTSGSRAAGGTSAPHARRRSSSCGPSGCRTRSSPPSLIAISSSPCPASCAGSSESAGSFYSTSPSAPPRPLPSTCEDTSERRPDPASWCRSPPAAI